MIEKILCPYHDEDTPSMVLYETHGHCYGCGAHVEIDKIKPLGGKSKRIHKGFARLNGVLDIDRTLSYINNLKRVEIRGFSLPADDEGYYLLYPNDKYFVKRWFEPPKGVGKYQYPRGHSLRLYRPYMPVLGPETPLLLIEGQINALSAAQAAPQAHIMSPGSCNELNKRKYINAYLQYAKICIIVDADAPGVAAALALKETLLKHGKKVAVYPMQQDMNAVYVTEGKEGVQKRTEEALGLL